MIRSIATRNSRNICRNCCRKRWFNFELSIVCPRVVTVRLASTAAPAEPKEEPLQIEQINSNDVKNSEKISRDSLARLIELSRQEWRLIALSATTLGVTSSITLLLPFASGQVIDYTIQSSSDGLSPVLLAGGLFSLTSVAGAGVYLRALWLARAGNRIVARLKQQMYNNLLQQESGFLEQQSVGDLLSRLSADAMMVQGAVTHQAVAALRAMVMTVGSTSMLLYTSPTLAVVSCLTLPPIFITTRTVGRKLQKQQEKVQHLQGEATSLAEQALSNSSTVKQFVAEKFESNRYHNAIAMAHSKALDTAHLQAQLEAGAHVAGNGAVLCVLGYGGSLVVDGVITAGQLSGFVMYSLLLAGNLSGLTSLYSDFVRAVAASNRVFDIMERKPKIPGEWSLARDIIDPLSSVEFSEPARQSNLIITKPVSVAFNSVDFSYPSRQEIEVLKDFNLTIHPGESIALVGGSGSGKSTVASLLTRLYDVNQTGLILINGKNIKDYDLHSLRRMIGVVPQEPTLLNGSIKDNIIYGSWGFVTEERILEAAKIAHVLDFANEFPDGLDTIVGQRGSQLSGGQRQRIALARMLVRECPLVILDEASASLDARSEHLIQEAMNTVMNNGTKTVIIIAHRLSSIRHADRIALIDGGAVVQSGPFNQLATVDGPFRDLMKTQLLSGTSSI